MQEQPLQFNAHVRTQPAGAVSGAFKCTVQPQGLHFQSKKQEFLVATGTPTEHLGNNRVRIHLPDYRMEVAVNAQGVYVKRLARDVALFLSGHGAAPRGDGYRMPGYFMALALAPVGIMAVTLGGALWGALAGGLCALNYGLLQQEEWPQPLRVGLALAATGVGYAGVIAMRLAL